jgi:hypothetical protein
MSDILYYRILRTPEGGVCGEMTVAGVAFFAMENLRQGSGYDSIPPGVYQLKMVKLGERDQGKKGPCLQFSEIPGRKGVGNPFLIHRAYKDNWKTLEGCIAPGMGASHPAGNQLNTRLSESEKAMDRILELLGGFEEGKVLSITIENAAPGQKDRWTREEFINRRGRKDEKNRPAPLPT